MRKKMRAKTVSERIFDDMEAKGNFNRETSVPTYDDLWASAPAEIKDYIEKSKETPQSPTWHPEGPVYVHNRIVYDRARKTGDVDLALAAFFHDLGKVDTTALNKKGTWSAHGHEFVSAKLVKKYADWIESLGADPEAVYQIVKEHMRIKKFDEMRPHKQQALRDNPFFDKINKFTEFDDMRNLSDDEVRMYVK